MTGESTDWEQRVDALWAAVDTYDEDDFVATMATLVDELPPDMQAKLTPEPPRSQLYQRLLTRAWTRFKTGQ